MTSGMANYEVLALLPTPLRMSDAQRDGHVCIYGGETITPGHSTQLGPRQASGRMIYPQVCQTCLEQAALNVLFDHSAGPDGCPDCKTEPVCELGQALNRLIRRRGQ